MASTIDGKKIAFLATDGVEQVELDRPWQAVRDAGGRPELVSQIDRLQAQVEQGQDCCLQRPSVTSECNHGTVV